jgi:Eco29kI restriction endonuclease
MASKRTKANRAVAGLPLVTSTPYDPLDLRTLAASMAKVVLEQPVYSLANLPVFEGAGVYVIYYTGGYEPYTSIAQKNRKRKWRQPIYVGEAARKGARKGGVLAEGPAGKVLFNRLKNHADSIRNTNNLNVEDFWCRYFALKDFFIPLCESLLIDRYTPIWNKVIDGFGNKVVGTGRDVSSND